MATAAPVDVVIVGAGAAGLAAAAMLRRRGLDPLVLERTDRVGSSWRARYDSLRLNTPRVLSTMPGYRMPRRYGRWPRRDDVVEYLEEYARRHRLRIAFGTEVRRIDRSDGRGWRLATPEGELAGRFVVVATGHDAEPKIPDWPGRGGFTGELLHSSRYRNPAPFEGKDVLLIEYICDTGLTLAYLLDYLRARGPASLRSCAFLDKPERRVRPVSVDYVGFTIPNTFVVGYGLDYNQLYRNLPYVGVLRPPAERAD